MQFRKRYRLEEAQFAAGVLRTNHVQTVQSTGCVAVAAKSFEFWRLT
jgi:hypothetical protein